MATLKKGYFITLISPKEVKKVLHKLSIRWRVCLAHIILFLVHPTLINRTRDLYQTSEKKMHLTMLPLSSSDLFSLFLIIRLWPFLRSYFSGLF